MTQNSELNRLTQRSFRRWSVINFIFLLSLPLLISPQMTLGVPVDAVRSGSMCCGNRPLGAPICQPGWMFFLCEEALMTYRGPVGCVKWPIQLWSELRKVAVSLCVNGRVTHGPCTCRGRLHKSRKLNLGVVKRGLGPQWYLNTAGFIKYVDSGAATFFLWK